MNSSVDEGVPRPPAGRSVSLNAKLLFPVVKLDEEETHGPFKTPGWETVVIRLQELVTRTGATTTLLRIIKEAGGIHEFVGAKGKVVILSTITRDLALQNLTTTQYVNIVDAVKPDHIFTWDGPTYLNEKTRSAEALVEIKKKSLEISELYPRYKLIGLVKGGTLDQTGEYSRWLADLGITTQVFHAGDYLRGGPRYRVVANSHANAARENARRLMIYGLGSAKNFCMFGYADVFITQSHFVRGYRNQKFGSMGWARHRGKWTPEMFMESLANMKSCIDSIGNGTQSKINEFVEPSSPCSLDQRILSRVI